MEIQTRVALTEIWLRDDLEVYAVRFTSSSAIRVPAGDSGALRAGRQALSLLMF